MLILGEEIVKYSKERFIILNMSNIFSEYNRTSEYGRAGSNKEVNKEPFGGRVISSLWKLVCNVAIPGRRT